jgi:DMSO reductase anchor subunit
MRALDVVGMSDLPPAVHPYPMPADALTRPQIVVTPHVAMQSGLVKEVANREEVRPPGPRRARTWRGLHLEDLPLVLFTLLGQAAAGVAVVALVGAPAHVPLLGIAGVSIALAALSALFHLGAVSQVWRTPAGTRTSPLSREVLAVGAFAAAWLAAWFAVPGGATVLAAAGVLLVVAMADVYALEAIPGWSRQRARSSFATSAVLFALIATLSAAGVVPAWVSIAIGAAVLLHQAVGRWRFYEARRGKLM